jgi:formylglycine-generating enzyme
MRSPWHRGGGEDHHAPVEMRFIDMFMTALGSLVFIALLLVFLLPKTSQHGSTNAPTRKQMEELQSENRDLRRQVQLYAQLPRSGKGGLTEDIDIMRRWFGVLVITRGCRAHEPELYARPEGKLVDVKTGAPLPDALEFDASDPSKKTINFGNAYFDIGDGSSSESIGVPGGLSVIPIPSSKVGFTGLTKNGESAKLFYGVSRGAGSWWSIYLGLDDPRSQGEAPCRVRPVFLTSVQGIAADNEVTLTEHQPFAWLRHFKINQDGTTSLITLPENDETFKHDLAAFSGKQSKLLFDRKGLCNTVDAEYALLSPQPPTEEVNPERPAGSTLWSFEDSSLYLVSDAESWKFYFNRPSCDQTAAGAKANRLVFDGKLSDEDNKKTFGGTAYAYSKDCEPVPYPVSGEAPFDLSQVSLRGNEPVRDDDCKVTGSQERIMIFSLRLRTSEDWQKRTAGLIVGEKSTFQECPDCPQMVMVPPGTFVMGSPWHAKPKDDKEPNELWDANRGDPYAGDRTEHQVTIADAFAMGKFDVTVDEFREFVEDSGYEGSEGCFRAGDKPGSTPVAEYSWRNPGFPQNGSEPVVCINWFDAKSYVDWLAKKTGAEYRLLTDAEWEYAARAGTKTAYYFGNDPTVKCKYGKVSECIDGFINTSPVGRYPANGFGLYDMFGNVWQGVQDCWHSTFYGAPDDGTAWPDANCTHQVRRGGSYFVGVASADAFPGVVDDRVNDVGLRVARSISEKDCQAANPVLAIAGCTMIIAAKSSGSSPELAKAYQKRGSAYLKFERFDDAITDYNSALRIEPKSAASLYGRGIAKWKKGDKSSGDDDTEAAKEIKPSIAQEFADGIKG